MKQHTTLVRFSLILGTLSIIFVCLSVLALMDIGGGREPDLMLEWAVVWLTVPLVLVSLVVSMAAVMVLARRKKRGCMIDQTDSIEGKPE